MCAEIGVIHTTMKAVVGNVAPMDGAFDKLYLKLHEPAFPLRLLPPCVIRGQSSPAPADPAQGRPLPCAVAPDPA